MDKHTESHHHILPLKVYFSVAVALLVFTVITVAVAQFHFGEFNLLIAMLVAIIKASLVALYFMHLRYDNKIYAVVFVGSLMFLAVFITFTMIDTLRRGDIYEEVAHPLGEAKMYEKLRAADTTSSADTAASANQSAAGH
jgi:cytochrome c oxidase subunit 4